MKLATYIKSTGATASAFAARIGVSHVSVVRYQAGRVPAPDVMQRIITETAGAVTADDFFDVPARCDAATPEGEAA